MNLREHLRHILPEILPAHPSESIKGTELIRLVRFRLGDEYSDATLRYHFSILSYDPTSPIAKVDQGQGYYLRTKRSATTGANGRQGLFEMDGSEGDLSRRRFVQVLAIYERLSLLRGQFPFVLNGRYGTPLRIEGDWEIPDVVCADWDVETDSDELPRFDKTMLSLRRHLGGPEVSVTGCTLKLGMSLESYLPDFFQAVSATRWATQSELVIAEAIDDSALVEALRQLGQQFGLGISTLGLNLSAVDDLPDGATILGMTSSEFDAVQTSLKPTRFTAVSQRPTLDWTTLNTLRRKQPSVAELVRWLSASLEKGRPEPTATLADMPEKE